MHYRLSTIVFACICCLAVASQAANTYLSLDFSVNRQTYNWSDSLRVSHNLGRKWAFVIHNRSAATLIKQSVLGGRSDRWQRTARTGASVDYRLRPSVTVGLLFSQAFDRLEEKRVIGNRLLLTSDLASGTMTLTQRAGVLWEERRFEPRENDETGVTSETDLNLRLDRARKWGEARVRADVTSLRQTPRKGVALSYSLPQWIYDSDTVSLSASQSFTERKYFPSSGNFEAVARQRSEQRRADFSGIKLLPAQFRLRLQAAYRFDEYSYQYEGDPGPIARQNDNFVSVSEYRVEVARYIGRRLVMASAYLYNRINEDFGAQQTNQLAETGQLSAQVNWLVGSADTISAYGQISVTSYLAPRTSTFFADRDRSLRVATVRVVHRFSDFLVGVVDGSYRGFHTIYISGQLSANNTINNVYILNPAIIWQPLDRLILRQDYQMHANYLYYEYERNETSERNTLYRRANLRNELTVEVSGRTALIFEYGYRYEDFGRLLWLDQWKQQLSWDRRTHRLRFTLEYRPVHALLFKPYALSEVQSSYDHVFDPEEPLGKREESDKLNRTLIGFELSWVLSNNSYVDARLERRVQKYHNQRNQEYDSFTIAIKRYW